MRPGDPDDAPTPGVTGLTIPTNESEAWLRTLLAPWVQATWEVSARGVMLGDSPGWRALAGQTLEPWGGEGWVGAVHPDERDQARQQWQEAIAQGTPFDGGSFACRTWVAGGGRACERRLCDALTARSSAGSAWSNALDQRPR